MEGITVMANKIFGYGIDPTPYYGRTIATATFDKDELTLRFTDGATINIWDEGQSCCESRYMTTSDDVSWLNGKVLTGLIEKQAPSEPSDYGDHEIVFLEVATSEGSITFENHNEHNGYYGGFSLCVEAVQPPPTAQ